MRALFIAMLLGCWAPVAAQADEAKELVHKVQAGGAAVVKDAKAVVGAAQDLVADAKSQGEAIIQAEPLALLKESAPRHLHNKIVHFPIALGFFGALFFLLSLRWAAYLWPSRVLLGSALLAGLAALPTGEAMEGAIEGTSLEQSLEAHERLGQISVALLALVLLLTFFPSARKWSWVVVLAAVAALAITGALGGALAHS